MPEPTRENKIKLGLIQENENKSEDNHDYENSCDCCLGSWSDEPNEYGICNCICDECGDNLRSCRYECEDNHDYENSCDCCLASWSDEPNEYGICNCICSNCGDDLRSCGYGCNE